MRISKQPDGRTGHVASLIVTVTHSHSLTRQLGRGTHSLSLTVAVAGRPTTDERTNKLAVTHSLTHSLTHDDERRQRTTTTTTNDDDDDDDGERRRRRRRR